MPFPLAFPAPGKGKGRGGQLPSPDAMMQMIMMQQMMLAQMMQQQGGGRGGARGGKAMVGLPPGFPGMMPPPPPPGKQGGKAATVGARAEAISARQNAKMSQLGASVVDRCVLWRETPLLCLPPPRWRPLLPHRRMSNNQSAAIAKYGRR